jgi:hypothetical protein
MKKQLEVWHDTHSDENAWCVSLCWESSGDEITCISTHDGREDAIEAGKKEAHKRGLAIFERGEYAELSEITE